MSTQPTAVEHLRERSRFVIAVGEDRVGLLDYEVTAVGPGKVTVWDLTHTVVRPDMRGRGLASELVGAVFDAAEAEGVRLRPVCPYVVTWLTRHPERASLVV